VDRPNHQAIAQFLFRNGPRALRGAKGLGSKTCLQTEQNLLFVFLYQMRGRTEVGNTQYTGFLYPHLVRNLAIEKAFSQCTGADTDLAISQPAYLTRAGSRRGSLRTGS
jgi:hypothetical protein